jgi:23S rRNA (cytosine1962-C5)-methyltransferase
MRRFAPGAWVLDVYCNDGAFALHAARGGAAGVIGIDISKECVERSRHNARMNGTEDRCRFEEGDAVRAMEWLRDNSEPFDVVILDPPSFARTKKNVTAARKGYEEVNARAMRLLKRDGILATASCSFHVTEETFLETVRRAASRMGRALRLLDWRGQAPDHPVLPAMPETRYLKFGLFQVG